MNYTRMDSNDVENRTNSLKREVLKNRDIFDDYYDRGKSIFELSKIDKDVADILNRQAHSYDYSYSPLEKTRDFLDNKKSARSGHLGYNSYPFGDVTPLLFKKFVGICTDKMTLKEILERLTDWALKVTSLYRTNGIWVDSKEEITAYIITDKWDAKQFAKYEESLLRRSIFDNVKFVFILITDYGYTEIPALPKHNSINISKNDFVKENEIVVLKEDGRSSHVNKRNIFYLSERKWAEVDDVAGTVKIGNLRKGQISKYRRTINSVNFSVINSHSSPGDIDYELYTLVNKCGWRSYGLCDQYNYYSAQDFENIEKAAKYLVDGMV